MENATYIYALSDPRTDIIKYIGQSQNIKKRFREHRKHKHSSVYKNWVSVLRKEGVKIKIEVIDSVPTEEWAFWEQHYISLYRSWNFPLENISNGGAINSSYEVSKRIRASGVYERQRERMKGDKNPARINQRPVLQYDLNNKFIREWRSSAVAAKELNLFSSGIARTVNGQNKHCGGFKWKYKKDIVN